VRADKRGYQRVVSLDTKAAEDRYGRELEGSATNPDRVYERQWALTLLERVLDGLGGEYEATGRGALFARLRFALTGDRSTLPYAALGEELGMSEGAVKVAVHRLRQRYRELLRSEIAQTVDGPAEVEAELRHLFRALAG
jgi:RNA polymerase sigma-70 factor (ECF subfamily)